MTKHNDKEREEWINNDEGLYRLWKCYGGSCRDFVRKNRKYIDGVIDDVLSGKRSAHYLIHG